MKLPFDWKDVPACIDTVTTKGGDTFKRLAPVSITLEPEEAQVLMDIIGTISGCPTRSRRKYTDAIWNKLKELGVRHVGLPDVFEHGDNISFRTEGL